MKDTKTMNETGSAVATRKRVHEQRGKSAPSAGQPDNVFTAQETRALLSALAGLKRGDGSVRLPVEWTGMQGKIAETFNEVVELNARMADELARLRQKVGKVGKLKQRVELADARGFWRDQVHCVNALIE